MEEVWKDIGIKKYAVSNMGNVRGADGIRLLKPKIDKYGYKLVTIYYDVKRKCRMVHQLVMEVFIGERPNGYVTDHINRIRDDNRLDNLRYCSCRENCLNTCKTRTDIKETNPILRAKILQKESDKKRYQENRDTKLELQKTYTEQNKEHYKEYQRKYRQKMKEAKL